MKQYGDITKLDGAKLEPVDLIVGGSPCQDLSIAGQRKGLEGERSGLFLEMIRVIKEMRNATNFIRPRWILWENVCGAFSSNAGSDYSAVLTELCRIAEPGTPDVPMPEEGWTKAGVLLGPDWSIAWRTHDAQYWGVPQRRRRIALVMDLRGQSAPEILFERKGVSGNIEPSAKAGKETTADAVGSTYPAIARSLTARFDSSPCVDRGQNIVVTNETVMIEMTSTKNTVIKSGICPTLAARMGTGGNQVNAVISFQERFGKKDEGILIENEISGALRTTQPKYCMTMALQSFGEYIESDVASSCKQRDFRDATDLVCRTGKVRRLTPLECERLQGFPDGWTDIPGASDSKRYRALGNSIALPFGLSSPSGLSALVR